MVKEKARNHLIDFLNIFDRGNIIDSAFSADVMSLRTESISADAPPSGVAGMSTTDRPRSAAGRDRPRRPAYFI